MLNKQNVTYPTAQEIMATPVSFRQDTIDKVLQWKKDNFKGWKDKSKREKLDALERLVYDLNEVYEVETSVNTSSTEYAYSPGDTEIYMDQEHPSIISTLHEFRHRLNGPSESSACRWSIWLFKTCFPRSFERLQFKENSHMLVMKS